MSLASMCYTILHTYGYFMWCMVKRIIFCFCYSNLKEDFSTAACFKCCDSSYMHASMIPYVCLFMGVHLGRVSGKCCLCCCQCIYKAKLSSPLPSTFPLLQLCCTPHRKVVQSVHIHGRSTTERKGDAKNSFRHFDHVSTMPYGAPWASPQ